MSAFFFMIILMSAGLAIDMGLMYEYRNQLQASADAAALAGAVGLGNRDGVVARDSAMAFNHRNRVGDSTNTLATNDAIAGTWHGSTFYARNWPDDSVYAVQVTTRYPAQYLFGRAAGFTSKTLTATAVAVHGSSPRLGCVRPWAVPYQSLLDQLGHGYTVAHDLTQADVAQLAAATSANQLILNQPGTGEGAPHQMRAVELPAAEYSDGTAGSPWNPSGALYTRAISEDCSALAAESNFSSHPYITVGDWLAGMPGEKKGDTKTGVGDLPGCVKSGNDVTCSPAAQVNVAIWDTYGPSTNGNCSGCYHVKYMGVFYVTGYQGPPQNNVTGYFSALTASPQAGGFSASPGPISKNALVR